MPPKVRRKTPSAKSRIEKTRDIGKFEQGWYRSKPGELKPAGASRSREGVFVYMPGKNDYSYIHTQPDGIGVPSHSDWMFFQSGFVYGNLRSIQVSAMDKNKVCGYLTLYATRKLRALAKEKKHAVFGDVSELDEFLVKMHRHLIAKKPINFNSVEYGVELVEWLKTNGLCRVKIRPMEGYAYKNGYFVKKKG